MGTRLDALDLAIANVQSSIPDVSAFVTSLQVRALIDTSLSDYYDKQAIDGKLADYYTKTEIGNNFYTKTEVDTLIPTVPDISNLVTTTDTRKLQLSNAQTTMTIGNLTLANIIKGTLNINFEYNRLLGHGDFRFGGDASNNWYIRMYGDPWYGAVIGTTNSSSALPKDMKYLGFRINGMNFFYYNNDQIALALNSLALNSVKYFQWIYESSQLNFFPDKIQLSNLSFDANTVVNSILSSSQTTTPNDTSIPTTLWVQNKLDAIPQTDAYTKTEVDNLIQEIFDKPETFNDDVTFNDVVVLTSTIALGTKVIDTVVRSGDNITPSDTNIPSTLWAQNKLNTKVDNGTVYSKVDLNNLLQLNNLSSIVLTYDHSESISFNRSELFFFSQSNSDTIGQKLYYNSRLRNFSYNGKILVISPISSLRTIEIRGNMGIIQPGNWYTILPNENFKTIKITRHEREFSPCYYQLPVIIGMPSYIPSVGALTDSISTSFFSLQLSFTYTFDDLPHVETWPYNYLDITTEIARMSGTNVLNQSKTRGGFYFICYGKTVNQNLWNYQTTVRWLFLGEQQSYSFTSDNGSVFYIPFHHSRYQIWYGQFKFKAENTNAPSFYRHSFQVNIPSASRISGGPDLDTFVIEIGDFTMACDMFYSTLTNLN